MVNDQDKLLFPAASSRVDTWGIGLLPQIYLRGNIRNLWLYADIKLRGINDGVWSCPVIKPSIK